MIGVVAGYQTKFGELWSKSLTDLIIEAGEGVIKTAGIKREEIELVVVANKLGGRIEGQDHLGSLAVEVLSLRAKGIRVEAACASGGVAIWQAVQAIKSGEVKQVLVIGVEKMTDKKNGEIAAALMGAASEEERRAGLSFPGLYGLMARKYMEKFGISKKDLAKVAVKNHGWGLKNPKAQFNRAVSVEEVIKSAMVAEPLGLLDCSPISDGAAAVILANNKGRVELVASELANDSLGLSQRKKLTEIKSTQVAGKTALRKAGLKVTEVDVAEVHDCFTIAEILAIEDLGFREKGKGCLGAGIPINTSGGLKACGHPVGATGVKQVVEIYEQLSRQAGRRQIKAARVGLTQNVGGTGGTVVVNILRKI